MDQLNNRELTLCVILFFLVVVWIIKAWEKDLIARTTPSSEIITNSPELIREFAKQCNGHVIYETRIDTQHVTCWEKK